MPALTNDELTYIRQEIGELLPDTGGAVLSVTYASDGMGGFTDVLGTVAANLAYRLDPLPGVEDLAGMGLQAFQGYQLTLPYDTTITPENRFQDGDGNRYSVLSVDAAKSWRASVRAKVEAL
jgi:hypothetical protein